MDTIDATEAGGSLEVLIGKVVVSHEPVAIVGFEGAAVLVGEADWGALQETLHLLSSAGVRESIIEGMGTPLDECSEGPDW